MAQMTFAKRLAVMLAAVGMSIVPALANLELCNNGAEDMSFAVAAQYGSPTFGLQQAYAYGWVTLKPGACHIVVRSENFRRVAKSLDELEQCPDGFRQQLFNLYMGAVANQRFKATVGK